MGGEEGHTRLHTFHLQCLVPRMLMSNQRETSLKGQKKSEKKVVYVVLNNFCASIQVQLYLEKMTTLLLYLVVFIWGGRGVLASLALYTFV